MNDHDERITDLENMNIETRLLNLEEKINILCIKIDEIIGFLNI